METHTHGVLDISLKKWKEIKKIYDVVCCKEQGYRSCCPPHKRCKVIIETASNLKKFSVVCRRI